MCHWPCRKCPWHTHGTPMARHMAHRKNTAKTQQNAMKLQSTFVLYELSNVCMRESTENFRCAMWCAMRVPWVCHGCAMHVPRAASGCEFSATFVRVSGVIGRRLQRGVVHMTNIFALADGYTCMLYFWLQAVRHTSLVCTASCTYQVMPLMHTRHMRCCESSHKSCI